MEGAERDAAWRGDRRMNGLDYVIVAAVIFGAVYGVSRGVLRMATSAASLVVGIYLASVYHSAAAAAAIRAMGPSIGPTLGVAIGYVLVFAVVFAGIEVAGSIVIRLLQTVHLSWADRLAGGGLGAGVAAVLAGLGVLLLTALMPSDSPLLRESKFAPDILAYNRLLLEYVPDEIRDAYQTRRDELMRYWSGHASTNGASGEPSASSDARNR
jgi:membrane protein required for colicin V production